MAAISHVFTLARVAKMLGEDEELLRRIAEDMDPEDGCLWVMGPDENDSTIAFTPFGVENPQQLLEHDKERGYSRTCSAATSDRGARRMDTDLRRTGGQG